jgi:acyl-CoA reductase-like NAD-dependent aldehyde dehydrogenase
VIAPQPATYIGGQAVGAEGDRGYEVIEPARGEVLGHVPEATAADFHSALTAARQAQWGWREMGAPARGAAVAAFGRTVAAHVQELAGTGIEYSIEELYGFSYNKSVSVALRE